MRKRKSYFVQMSKGDWVLTSSKGKTLRRYATRQQAIEDGAARASGENGQLTIKKLDGRVESERTYRR